MVHFDIDKLDELPHRQEHLSKWKKSIRNYNGYINTFGKRNPYFTARKIIENNIGNSYNLAFFILL